MRHYSHFGYREFAIALGYKADVIKRYFMDLCSISSDLTIKTRSGEMLRHESKDSSVPDWMVNLVDTGMRTQTGGRIKRLHPIVGNSTFMLTWGDGVSNVDLHKLLAFHRSHGKLATVTAVRPPARFGHMVFGKNDRVIEFSEKPQASEGWINGAFFVLEPGIFDYIEGDKTFWEKEPMEGLARDGQLMAYKHTDYWQCMDTLRDKIHLESLWNAGNPPWRTWDQPESTPAPEPSANGHAPHRKSARTAR
jgi:glucose-1-phosphate cytidylyltransferase